VVVVDARSLTDIIVNNSRNEAAADHPPCFVRTVNKHQHHDPGCLASVGACGICHGVCSCTLWCSRNVHVSSIFSTGILAAKFVANTVGKREKRTVDFVLVILLLDGLIGWMYTIHGNCSHALDYFLLCCTSMRPLLLFWHLDAASCFFCFCLLGCITVF
jgi:hypothetical protein